MFCYECKKSGCFLLKWLVNECERVCKAYLEMMMDHIPGGRNICSRINGLYVCMYVYIYYIYIYKL